MNQKLTELYDELEKFGILMLTDSSLPSLTSVVAGAPVKGSWWGHPLGNLMYNLSNEFLDSADLLSIKLINKKTTFVQKKYWSAVVAVGSAQEVWQIKKLSPECKKLFQLVKTEGEIITDNKKLKKSATEIGKLASKLEERLLICSGSIHTPSGKHVRVLKSWENEMHSRKFKWTKISYDEAIHKLEILGAELTNVYNTKVKFPWL